MQAQEAAFWMSKYALKSSYQLYFSKVEKYQQE